MSAPQLPPSAVGALQLKGEFTCVFSARLRPPLRQELLLSSLCKRGNRGSEKLRDLPRVAQPGQRTPMQAPWLQQSGYLRLLTAFLKR